MPLEESQAYGREMVAIVPKKMNENAEVAVDTTGKKTKVVNGCSIRPASKDSSIYKAGYVVFTERRKPKVEKPLTNSAPAGKSRPRNPR